MLGDTMFGGNARPFNEFGEVASPLNAGFGSGPAMMDQFTNTALNQNNQDLQNQQLQNTLQQQLLDNPNIAAQRGVTGGQLGIQQGLINSGQAQAAASSQMNAQTQANLAKMSGDQLTVVQNHGAAYVAANEFAKVNPDASMPGTKAHQQMLNILTNAGIKNVPDLAGPDEMRLIQSRAESAPSTLKFIQQTKLQEAELGTKVEVAKIGAAAQVESAQLGKISDFYKAMFMMPPNQRIINTTQMEVQQQRDEKGQNYMTPYQLGQVTNIVRNNMSPDDRAQAMNVEKQTATAVDGMSMEKAIATAQGEKIPIKDSKGNAFTQKQLSNAIAAKAYNDSLQKRVTEIVQSQFPAAKNIRSDLPGAQLDPGTTISTSQPPSSSVGRTVAPLMQSPGTQPPGGQPPASAAPPQQPQDLVNQIPGMPQSGQSLANQVPQGSAPPPPAPTGPKVGEVIKGYKFMGGDPSNKRSWMKYSG